MSAPTNEPRTDWLQGTVLLFDETKRRRKKWNRKESLQLDLLIVRTETRKAKEKRR